MPCWEDGLRSKTGAYRHPNRTAIFVGDFIDRGPKQVESVMTARRMVEAGSALAVMGNHEFNAMAWHTEDPDRPGHYLRPRSGALGANSRAQHQAFLNEVEGDCSLHADLMDWFTPCHCGWIYPICGWFMHCWHADTWRRCALG
jgi:hypothetical protein